MRYIIILLLIYVVYRIARYMIIKKFREMTGAGNPERSSSKQTSGEKRTIEDAKFTEIKDDTSDEKK